MTRPRTCRKIRIENVVTDEIGEQARLKPGAKVDVVVEADSDATIKKLIEFFSLAWGLI